MRLLRPLVSSLVALLLGCGTTANRNDEPPPLDDDTGTPVADATGEVPAFDIGSGPDIALPDGLDKDGGCASATAAGSKLPVDIIFIIDQSGSMGTESTQVQTNLNKLAKDLDATKLDYRVVMVAGYSSGALPMCVPPPLAKASCLSNPPKFRASDQHVESWDALKLLLQTYDSTDPRFKWSDVLRKDAFKIFIPITDDDAKDSALYSGPGTAATAFDTAILSKGAGTTCGTGCFGTKTKRKYAFYPNCGVTTGDPTYTTKCPTAVNTGGEYLELVKLTKAKAFSVCETDYAPVFKEIAKAIITTVACEIVIPPPPAGEIFDPNKVNVTVTAGGVTTNIVRDDSAPCTGGANGWQYNADKTKILLCGEACTKAKADASSVINVIFGCGTVFK